MHRFDLSGRTYVDRIELHLGETVSIVKTAVFPVAGLGTRFLPATKSIPKEMLPLVDRPLIQHAVEEAREAGIENFIFISSRGKAPMEEHFDYNDELDRRLWERGKKEQIEAINETLIPDGHLQIVRQARPLGLGHAVWLARKIVGNNPFAVLLPDEVVLSQKSCLAQMMDAYDELGGNLVSVLEVPQEEVERYGILKTSQDTGKTVAIDGMVEKPKPKEAPSNLAITGRYILQPEIFEHLSRHERGAGGEIQLTDAMVKLIGKQPFHGVRFEGHRFDCGNRLGFVEANIAFSLSHPEMAPYLKKRLRQMLDEF